MQGKNAFSSYPNPWHAIINGHAHTDNRDTAAHCSLPGHRSRHYARRGFISHEQHCVALHGGPLSRLLRASAARTTLYGLYSARSAAPSAASPPCFWRGASAAYYAGVAPYHASDPDVSGDQGSSESREWSAGESVSTHPAS